MPRGGTTMSDEHHNIACGRVPSPDQPDPQTDVEVLMGRLIDSEAYFVIQKALADDTAPPPVAVNLLAESLDRLLESSDVPDTVQRQLGRARGRVGDLQESIDTSRRAFRVVSHSMLRAAAVARGPATAQKLIHFHCPMVPGGGGD